MIVEMIYEKGKFWIRSNEREGVLDDESCYDENDRLRWT